MLRYQICSIPGYSSRSDRNEFHGVKFHCLPQDPVLRYKWLVSIKSSISVSQNTKICSLHFEGVKEQLIAPYQPFVHGVCQLNTDNPSNS